MTTVAAGIVLYLFCRIILTGIYTVGQNERAVLCTFGRAERLGTRSTLEEPLSANLNDDEKERYSYPLLRVIPPGGPYLKMPWQTVHKISIATETVNMAFDPEEPEANSSGTLLEAVTRDQLNVGLSGQIRFSVSERNLYAYIFGVKNPLVHVMGFFVSVLRERIANFQASRMDNAASAQGDSTPVDGISINDFR